MRIFFLTLLIFSITLTVQSQTNETILIKGKFGMTIPTGDLVDEKVNNGFRGELGIDFYLTERFYLMGNAFFSYMSTDKTALVEAYESLNRTVLESDISNHAFLGFAIGAGYDFPLSQSLSLSPSGSLYYIYISPSRAEEFIQNDASGRPLYKESAEDFGFFGGYGFRPSLDLKWNLNNKVGVSLGASYDLYFYVDPGFVQTEYYDPNFEQDPDFDSDFGLNGDAILSINAGIYFRVQ